MDFVINQELFPREKYLSKIRGFYHECEIIKVITGVRRCGKSSLMNLIIQELQSGGTVKAGKKSITTKKSLPEEYAVLKDHLAETLKAKVQMTLGTGGKGKITIPFNSGDDLDRLMQILIKR